MTVSLFMQYDSANFANGQQFNFTRASFASGESIGHMRTSELPNRLAKSLISLTDVIL